MSSWIEHENISLCGIVLSKFWLIFLHHDGIGPLQETVRGTYPRGKHCSSQPVLSQKQIALCYGSVNPLLLSRITLLLGCFTAFPTELHPQDQLIPFPHFLSLSAPPLTAHTSHRPEAAAAAAVFLRLRPGPTPFWLLRRQRHVAARAGMRLRNARSD